MYQEIFGDWTAHDRDKLLASCVEALGVIGEGDSGN
jgi:hypothetical protein